VGHPPILNYDVVTNLEPTVGFYQDALMDMMGGNETATGTRLAAFLCESPGLLEYNVQKRLMPRLSRAQAELEDIPVDEEFLRAIATKTDSRFEEWLDEKKGGGDNGDQPFFENHDEDVIKRTPSSYVVLSNLQSGGNIGNILRSASIFGCEELVFVGQKRHRLTGDHGSRFDLRRRHMWSHIEARDYLHKRGVRIYGIEIMADALPIMRYDPETGVVRFPFDRQWQGAAFVMGNEGNGLSAKQREICDEFLYIPQTRGGKSDGGGSASLNVACAATVILQAYCTWASYPDAEREGEKFVAFSGENERLRYQSDR
jgi:tRNA G18 (ribose-2'-O)-methylase SpoU